MAEMTDRHIITHQAGVIVGQVQHRVVLNIRMVANHDAIDIPPVRRRCTRCSNDLRMSRRPSNHCSPARYTLPCRETGRFRKKAIQLFFRVCSQSLFRTKKRG